MTFDLKAELKKTSVVKEDTSKLAALILGPSGGGKSTAIGSLGVKTMLLYTRGENHAPAAAKMYGGKNIVPICLDYVDGETLNPSQTLKRCMDILGSTEAIKAEGFKAVVIDSATELEAMIKGSQTFINMVGGNDFKKADVAVDMMRAIILKLIDLQREIGIHYVVTCALDVKELSQNGEIIDAQPKLVGYRLAENLVQMFSDVIVVGAMSNGDDVQHRFQFASGVSKQQKDKAGGIKKTVNFRPRLTSVDLTKVLEPHGTTAADFKILMEMKKGTYKKDG